ncbi:helicase associated domain-containing protein [Streptomyces sp. NPDC048269]|uniref:helicase associated domain-containing protein n=1 Tax=Streptomyces sp. NPDC048269 TaxID=3155753 RepID=UPI00343E4BB7
MDAGAGPRHEAAEEEKKLKPRRTQADTWAMHLAAAVQFFEREGHLRVPLKHVETIPVDGEGQEQDIRLGSWIGNQRSSAATLAPERVEQLSSGCGGRRDPGAEPDRGRCG